MCCGSPLRGLIDVVQALDVDREQSSSQPQNNAAQLTCPNCNAIVHPGFTWCPTCSMALKPQPCAYCGQLIAPNEKKCSGCGAPGKMP